MDKLKILDIIGLGMLVILFVFGFFSMLDSHESRLQKDAYYQLQDELRLSRYDR